MWTPSSLPGHAEDELFTSFANADWETTAELTDWLVARRLLDGRGKAERLADEVSGFGRLRDLVRGVADRLDRGHGPSGAQVAELNRFLRGGPHVHALHASPSGSTLVARGVGKPADHARAVIAGSMARFLAEEDPGRLRRCASDTCRWVFIDRSPTGRRRWCDMSVCGNRAKVRRHRARQRRGAATQRSSATHSDAAGIE